MGSIRNEDHQVELEDTTPQINNLEIEDVFKDEDEKEGVGVTDLINGLIEILQLEAEGLQDTARQAFGPVKPWDKGQVT